MCVCVHPDLFPQKNILNALQLSKKKCSQCARLILRSCTPSLINTYSILRRITIIILFWFKFCPKFDFYSKICISDVCLELQKHNFQKVQKFRNWLSCLFCVPNNFLIPTCGRNVPLLSEDIVGLSFPALQTGGCGHTAEFWPKE